MKTGRKLTIKEQVISSIPVIQNKNKTAIIIIIIIIVIIIIIIIIIINITCHLGFSQIKKTFCRVNGICRHILSSALMLLAFI